MHQITLKGLDDEELEIIQDAVNGNISLTLADCLPRILKRLTMTIYRDVDKVIYISDTYTEMKDGGTQTHLVLNPEEIGHNFIRKDGAINSPTRGKWVLDGELVSEDRLVKYDRYKYKADKKAGKLPV